MKITFLPQNITTEVSKIKTILEVATEAGVNIDGNCAGMGTCGKCKVKIIEGDLSQCVDNHGKLTENEIKEGYRLACCHNVTGNMVIEVAEAETTAARKKKMVDLPEDFRANSAIKKHYVELNKATLQEQSSMAGRILNALSIPNIKFENNILIKVSDFPKGTDAFTVTTYEDKIIDIEAGDTTECKYGLALDIGTTTVVAMLWNLSTNQMIDISAMTNPQGAYGADVISRITYSIENEDNRIDIHNIMINAVNNVINQFEKENNINSNDIYYMTVVGNTTMSHMFLGVNTAQLAVSPFEPIFTEPVFIKASDLNININNNSTVVLLPNIAGHVGSDITAGIITTKIMDKDEGHLFIDIGTNGEIVLSGNGRAVTCSTAAGPAFEGSSIMQGMRAARGAVEGVSITDNDVEIKVIGDVEPIGICGSGIIDAVGELIRVGIVDKSGRLMKQEKALKKGINENIVNHIRESDGGNDFILYKKEGDSDDIVITQKDVREVQLAKAAISAGIAIMMKEIGVTGETLARISIAGAFGNYINKSSAINVGLLPKIDEDKIYSLGNSAGIGASMALLSTESLEEAIKSAKDVEHIELASRSDFQDEYMMAMRF